MIALRNLYGPSKKEVWEKLSQEIRGKFIEGGTWKADKVVAVVGEWTVTLDTYKVSDGKGATFFTRIRAPYMNADGFRF